MNNDIVIMCLINSYMGEIYKYRAEDAMKYNKNKRREVPNA